MIWNVDYHITDICNLNCASCSHYCPLVDKSVGHKSLKQIKADLYLLSKFSDIINCVTLLGGEPTLHPDLEEILRFAREIFPYKQINLTSNGVLWRRLYELSPKLEEYNITLWISRYPFREDWREWYQGNEEQMYIHNYSELDKFRPAQMSNHIINDKEQSLKCRWRGQCCHLKNGRLYICNYSGQFDILKKRFGDAIKIDNEEAEEYVDLNVCTAEDIENLCYNATPKICQYCKECQWLKDDDVNFRPWEISKNELSEWVTE